jgi:ATP-dependent DNA helicase RecG
VISHVQEYGKITNKTLRNMFDIDIHPAKDIIKGLVERGILVKTSERERGPNIEYGPGPSFPSPRRRGAARPAEPPSTVPVFSDYEG